MNILIGAATPREMQALAPSFFPTADAIPEMQPIRAQLKNATGIFIVTGVGIINTALALGYCLGLSFEKDKPAVDAILFAGLAGAFDLNVTPLTTIWQINEEIWPEYGLHDGSTVTARAFSHPLWKMPDGATIYDKVNLASVSSIAGPEKVDIFPQCSALTVAGVSASFNRREKLWNQYHAPLENMEGFAAAYTALRAEIACVEIRSVSNKVGPRSREEKDFDGALKALNEILPSLNLV